MPKLKTLIYNTTNSNLNGSKPTNLNDPAEIAALKPRLKVEVIDGDVPFADTLLVPIAQRSGKKSKVMELSL